VAGVRKEGVERARQEPNQLERYGRGERIPFTMYDEHRRRKGT
jgi:hypothetical protein